MLPDRDNRNYIRTTASGKFKLYYFPRTARPGTKQVVLLDVLNHVRCTGVARGYGSNGRTVVRVAQWGWSSARLDIARRLWTLHDQGCNVQIIGNGFKTGDRVLQTLLKPSRNGRMRFYDAAVNVTGDPRREYMHHKVVAVSGVWFGHPDTKVVYTGSANFTEPGTSSNNELVMRVLDGPTYDAYARNFAMIRDDHTRRVTKAPTTSVAQAARKDAALDRELETGLDRG
jgi:phosphatidylserine/phosphatidylglycerophosphate/cardiolipin synthase-like enzyme